MVHGLTREEANSLLEGRTVVSIREAALVLGVSSRSAYAAAKNGQLPAIHLGHRYVVPAAKLREMLGGAE